MLEEQITQFTGLIYALIIVLIFAVGFMIRAMSKIRKALQGTVEGHALILKIVRHSFNDVQDSMRINREDFSDTNNEINKLRNALLHNNTKLDLLIEADKRRVTNANKRYKDRKKTEQKQQKQRNNRTNLNAEHCAK